MATTLTSMPAKFTSGETVKYTVTHPDYPASSGWTLTLYLAGIDTPTPIAGNASGDSFAITISSAASAAIAAGVYQYEERATKSSETYIAASGKVTVLANIAAAAAGDFREFAETALEIVEAAIAGRLTSDMQSFTIAGRAVTKIPIAELLDIRAKLQAEIASSASPGTFGKSVLVQFVRPGA